MAGMQGAPHSPVLNGQSGFQLQSRGSLLSSPHGSSNRKWPNDLCSSGFFVCLFCFALFNTFLSNGKIVPLCWFTPHMPTVEGRSQEFQPGAPRTWQGRHRLPPRSIRKELDLKRRGLSWCTRGICASPGVSYSLSHTPGPNSGF